MPASFVPLMPVIGFRFGARSLINTIIPSSPMSRLSGGVHTSPFSGILRLLIFMSLAMLASNSYAQQARHVYSVKYVCGINGNPLNSTTATVAAGAYKTDINVQRATNAGEGEVTFRPVEARTLVSEAGGPVGRSHRRVLRAPDVVSVICDNINGLFSRTTTNQFTVGYLQIFSFEPLSVVAVYTGKECRTTVGSEFLRNAVCEGDLALDVVRYDAVLVETMEKGGSSDLE